MQMRNYEKELSVAMNLAAKAGKEILKIYYGDMETMIKEDKTPVTNADILSNEIIVNGLQKAFPSDGIVSEELDDIAGGRTWYVDPIDGTKGFICRTDQFAIHIGLVEDEDPVLGIVYKPTTGECYYATKERGAYRSNPDGSKKELHLNGDGFNPEDISIVINNSFLTQNFGTEVLKELKPRSYLISGSEGLRIMKVAENIGDLHVSNNRYACNTWDLCAPQAIVEGAGAYTSYIDGNPLKYHGQRKMGKHFVVARNEELAKFAAKGMRKVIDELSCS